MGRQTKYRVAVVQSGTDVANRWDHIQEDMTASANGMVRWIRFLNENDPNPPRIIVFSVLKLVGATQRAPMTTDMPLNLAGPDIEPALEPLVTACRAYGCYVVTSTVEAHPALPGRLFHSGVMLGPDGVAIRQPKVQAPTQAEVTEIRTIRDEYVKALGEDAVHQVVDTPYGRIGLLLHAEQFIPEIGRGLRKNGAEILVHPNLEFPGKTLAYRAAKQSVALQNQVYLISANIAYERMKDDSGEMIKYGRGESLIAGPDGQLLALCDYVDEGYATATVDLDHLQEMRDQHGSWTIPAWGAYNKTYSD